jgi:tripartite-type tricarboxylate transporter receptor subunit TctC
MNLMQLKSVAVAFAAVVLLIPRSAPAASVFPDKPIKLISAFAAGGTTDIVARAISQPLGQLLGVPVIVEDRIGATGTIAANYVATSQPDGYILLVTTASPVVVVPHTSDEVRYDPKKDLAAVTLIGITPEVLAINPKVAATNLKELVALSESRQITIASSGEGGLPHLVIELLRSSSSDRIVHVPFKAAGPAVIDTLGGHVDGVIVDLPAVFSQIMSNQLRGIAVANVKRSEFLPNLPTTGELGFPKVVGVNWTGIMAPGGTPPAVIDKLYAALIQVMKLESVKKAMALAAIEVSVSSSPSEFTRFIATEDEKWKTVVKDAGIKRGH